ncbi:McrB family protein [Marinimicrobium agarilyticum]|uniref:McrB family protein n=1 Tax=Marinimicrobium agarilyticum TaxID=306546 RepID=UPI0003FA6B3E|nr:ATP-binding protein [Marinimicrobium agarilyticum]
MATQLNFTEDETLKATLEGIKPFERNPDWLSGLTAFLEFVQSADLETRKTREFQQVLWEESRVSGVGMGTVDVSAALEAPEFCEWVAEQSVRPVPEDPEARLAFFQAFHDGLVSQMKTYCKRVAWVKIFRVLAAFYPRYFTTITYRRMALECHRAWFGKQKKPGGVKRQLDLMTRLHDLLGPPDDSPRLLAERMTLPWMVYQEYVQSVSTEAEAETTTDQGEITLKPLPALQRRKGFTSIRGGLASIISALSFVVDGVSREELMDYLRSELPDYRDSSLRTLITILKNEFYVIQEQDGIFTQTARGELFLETQDPQELIPLFITRTLGVDHVLCALKEKEQNQTELVQLLQKVNPGWTTTYAPAAMLKWLRDFELLEQQANGQYRLTDIGRDWVEQIHWEPEFLEVRSLGEEPELSKSSGEALSVATVDQTQLIQSVVEDTAFAERLVSQLHLGLWSRPRRHFAILAGLSGSGKTLLAQRYGAALVQQFKADPARHVFVQAVQPGWYDPSPLFGYINPLVPEKYERSGLLDFLLQASNHPEQPFVVILDEMNLSHPEHYFAPVLSSMESGDQLRLHDEADTFDGVPKVIPFPANVAFIGTVNMDETTHGLSDKVLDRAFTLEFWDIDLADYPRWEQFGLEPAQLAEVRQCLSGLLTALAPERLHFGWRSVEDVLSYLQLAREAPNFSMREALDDVVYARILPKLRGSESERLQAALTQALTVLDQHGLSRCKAKVQALKTDLSDTGMMRFWR